MQIKLEKERVAILLTAEGRTTTNKFKKKGEGRIFSKGLDLVQSLKFPLFESLFVLLVLHRIFISFQGFISVYQVLYFLFPVCSSC